MRAWCWWKLPVAGACECRKADSAARDTEQEKTLRIRLSVERETKNTVRFAEDTEGQPPDHPGAPVIGTLYIQKFAWAQLGKPERIVVSLDAVPAAPTAPTHATSS